MTYQCPVCGYPGLEEPARDEENVASLEICPSCGFHFGFDDDSEGISYEEWRHRWKAKGMPWFSEARAQPAGWDPVEQLRSVEG
jgi:hypothetical protein